VPTPSRSVAAPSPTGAGAGQSSPVGSAGAAPKQTAAVGAILGLGAAIVHFL
jgi:hypothetical protein